jgi:hypothetical protein
MMMIMMLSLTSMLLSFCFWILEMEGLPLQRTVHCVRGNLGVPRPSRLKKGKLDFLDFYVVLLAKSSRIAASLG